MGHSLSSLVRSVWRIAPRLLEVEEGQIDSVRHRLVASIVRVQAVFREAGLETTRLGRVASSGVEVDDSVIDSARSDPLVDRLAFHFAFRAEVESASNGVKVAP